MPDIIPDTVSNRKVKRSFSLFSMNLDSAEWDKNLTREAMKLPIRFNYEEQSLSSALHTEESHVKYKEHFSSAAARTWRITMHSCKSVLLSLAPVLESLWAAQKSRTFHSTTLSYPGSTHHENCGSENKKCLLKPPTPKQWIQMRS